MAGREIEAVKRAVDLFQAGISVLEAAAGENIAPSTLYRAIFRRGLLLRDRPEKPRSVDSERVVSVYRRCRDVAATARECAVGRSTVYRLLDEAGVPRVRGARGV